MVNNRMPDDMFDHLADEVERRAENSPAPSSLKARLYTRMIARQSETAPLRDLSETAAAGAKLCIFEQIVEIAPVGQSPKQYFYCSVCHARVVAEKFDNPPVFWPGCPYVQLKNDG